VAVVPIFKSPEEREKVSAFIDKLLAQLCGDAEVASAKKRGTDPALPRYFFDKLSGQSIVVDWRDNRPGDKQFYWEQRGVPFRFEVGPRDVDGGAFVSKKRLDRSKEIVQLATATADWLRTSLDAVQNAMLDKARSFRDANIRTATTYDEMKTLVAAGGFVRCYFEPNPENEKKIKDQTKATVRCIPFDYNGPNPAPGNDIYTGNDTTTQVVFAESY
jgi:prolyl-tRNA synthetase